MLGERSQPCFHTYYPYGREQTTLQESDRMKFTGHERDLANVSGDGDDLDYMHARHYSPVTGRFLSVDPIGGSPAVPQSWNAYAYVMGRAMSYTDPTGMQAMGRQYAPTGMTVDDRDCKWSIEMSETRATLRVMGLTLEPALVTEHLGREPSQAHRAGDPNIGSSGKRYADFREGLWALDSDLPSHSSLAEHLRALVELMRLREAKIVRLKELGYRLDVYLSVFDFEGDEGFFFSADLLETLGRLGVDLNLDLYSSVPGSGSKVC